MCFLRRLERLGQTRLEETAKALEASFILFLAQAPWRRALIGLVNHLYPSRGATPAGSGEYSCTYCTLGRDLSLSGLRGRDAVEFLGGIAAQPHLLLMKAFASRWREL